MFDNDGEGTTPDQLFETINTEGSYLDSYKDKPVETKEEPKEEVEQVKDTPQEASIERMLKIKVAGVEIEMPESEVIKRAQMGEDYTRKTQAVADERRKLDEEKSRVEAYVKEMMTQSKSVEPAQEESPIQEFKRLYQLDYDATDERHIHALTSIIQSQTEKKVEARLMEKLEAKQKQTEVGKVQTELNQLASFLQQNPPEVGTFIESSIYSLAGDAATRSEFNVLYPALQKALAIAGGRLDPIHMSMSEANKLHDYAVKATKDYYLSKAPKTAAAKIEVESSSPSVKTDGPKKMSPKEIRDLDHDGQLNAFGAYLEKIKKRE